MNGNVVVIEKMENGDLVQIDERSWSAWMVAMLEHSNYLLVDDKEYEMVEGRLNVSTGKMEIMVISIR